MYIISLTFFTTFVAFVRADSNLIVTTHSGTIKGIRHIGTNRTFRAFYSIPYAEPPVAELRFQPPVPVKPWYGIRDGTKPPPVCTQPSKYTEINSPSMGQEDCLFLNIFVPNELDRTVKKFPVIVYIHGGAFQSGSANYHPGDYFMDRNVIFVAINYRLGALGFLGMNNDVISGNFGMKDQSMALKWIKENIEAFGGDPDSITLMGESAGSAAVHAHMFSPLSKGLFHKAIMQSGNMFAGWTYYDEAYTEASFTAFAFATGCFNKDNVKVLKCLQRVSAEDLIKTESRLFVWDLEPTVLFKLTLESKVKNQPFLPSKPGRDTYITKDIPWIIGMNSAEGTFKVQRFLGNGGSLAKIINGDRKRIIPLLNQYLFTTEPELIDNITEKICDRYFNKNEIGANTISEFVQMVSDSYFTHSIVRMLLTNQGLHYMYYYDHRKSYLYADKTVLGSDLGVNHADELNLLFRYEENEKKYTPEDRIMSAELIKLWTNFATYSDPNGNFTQKVWKPVETDAIEYLHITSKCLIMENNFLKERYDFWNSLPLGRKFTRK